MRTAKEIRNYLKQQKWYKDFVRNTRLRYRYHNKNTVKYVLRGYCKIDTIKCAFYWDRTPQYYKYWKAMDGKFRNWYNKGGVK